MGSEKRLPVGLDDLHFIPAQVSEIPLNPDENVNTGIIIGKDSRRPLKLSSPVMISGMSYGAVSRKTRQAIASAARDLGIGFNSGEGGVLEYELNEAGRQLIVQYSTGRFGITEDILRKAAAIEIRFGQGAYPGKGVIFHQRRSAGTLQGSGVLKRVRDPIHRPITLTSGTLRSLQKRFHGSGA